MKRKSLIVFLMIVLLLTTGSIFAYFGIQSTFSANRENGANLKATAFAQEYNAVEHSLQDGFMTTVDKGGATGCHVFFLHGGGCVMDAVAYHTDVICALADRGLRVTAYDYPLFPETEYTEICQAVYDAYLELIRLYPDDEIAIYGDSAGGSLALHLLMQLRDETMERRPSKTVLVSPMLDLSMSNPEIQQYIAGDTSLDYNGCKILSFYMAGLKSKKSPELSPIYGDLSDLGELQLFYGSREILRPDCERLVNLVMDVEGTEIEAYMGEGKLHDYVMIVTEEESVIAFDRMTEFLK